MAFKNAGIVIGITQTILYTCPALSEAVVHSLFVSNTSVNDSGTVTIEVVKVSPAGTHNIGTDLPVPLQSTLIVDKPINLETGDSIRLTSTSTATLEAFASILEQAL